MNAVPSLPRPSEPLTQPAFRVVELGSDFTGGLGEVLVEAALDQPHRGPDDTHLVSRQ